MLTGLLELAVHTNNDGFSDIVRVPRLKNLPKMNIYCMYRICSFRCCLLTSRRFLYEVDKKIMKIHKQRPYSLPVAYVLYPGLRKILSKKKGHSDFVTAECGTFLNQGIGTSPKKLVHITLSVTFTIVHCVREKKYFALRSEKNSHFGDSR